MPSATSMNGWWANRCYTSSWAVLFTIFVRKHHSIFVVMYVGVDLSTPVHNGSRVVFIWLRSKRWSSTCFLRRGRQREISWLSCWMVVLCISYFGPLGFIGTCKPAHHCIPAKYVDLIGFVYVWCCTTRTFMMIEFVFNHSLIVFFYPPYFMVNPRICGRNRRGSFATRNMSLSKRSEDHHHRVGNAFQFHPLQMKGWKLTNKSLR